MSENYDGITRQRSRCKVIIHSHIVDNTLPAPENRGRYDLSRDVIGCETSKSIKGGGGASVTMVPRRNYMNLVFPNDYVNIYFDPGDGRGFIRTFFGFVDRISRTIATDPTGKTSTRYQIVCSDFTKAFDKTEVYFNAQIGNRPDIAGSFAGTANLGGFALRTKGITMHGSPADIMLGMVHVLLGFGAQYILPPGYDIPSAIRDSNRQYRIEWSRERLSADILQAMGDRSFSEIDAEIKAEQDQAELAATGGFSHIIEELDETGEIEKIRLKARQNAIKRLNLPANFFQRQEVRAARTVELAASTQQSHLLDLIDFRHVEWRTMDGFVLSSSTTQEEGSLWSIMNAWSNDMINELFCDLRPMQSFSGGGASGGRQDQEVFAGGYSVEADELEGNSGPAVRYAPCIIMREYPFGTIEGIDPPPSVQVLKRELGLVIFGNIFAQEPNSPGRKVVQMPALHETLLEKYRGNAVGNRHLDVCVINTQDIIQENIGRGDSDHVNLIEVYSDLSSGTIQHSRQILRDIVPIISAVHVARHGLRVRRYHSRFGRFGGFRQASPARVDSVTSRRVLARWALLLDHWYQHNLEYLSGSVVTRAFPEVRAGYRLDVEDRNESYYVESVNHAWQYPNVMTTTMTLSRGQRNDPYPVYVLPQGGGISGGNGFAGIRDTGSRLGEFFVQKDTTATTRSLILKGESELPPTHRNFTDMPATAGKRWANNENSYLAANSAAITAAITDQESREAEEKRARRRGLLDVEAEGGETGASGVIYGGTSVSIEK